VPDPEWKAAAITDLLAILDYISDDNPDAAQALKDEIENKTSRLPEHPQMYRAGRVEGTREMVVRPNYIVVYAENPDAVTIRRFPARSTAMMSPYRMPSSDSPSPSTGDQNVEVGCRTTQAIGSNLSSRSSPASDGKPALTGRQAKG